MERVVRGTLRDRRSRRRRRCRCHSILSQVFVALSPCQLDFSRHMFDLQQLKMNLIKILRDSKFSGFFSDCRRSHSSTQSVCAARTHIISCTHTIFFFARLFFLYIFAITSCTYFYVWNTHHSARYDCHAELRNHRRIIKLPDIGWSCVVRTKFLLPHATLMARRQMKSIPFDCWSRLEVAELKSILLDENQCVTHSALSAHVMRRIYTCQLPYFVANLFVYMQN